MEIKQLRSFVTVADCGSFSRAAQILYISQPSISTHVSMLEQEVGVKLIKRTSKSFTLTEAGIEFYEHAVNILKINDKMLSDIGDKAAPCIHIGASTVPSAYILPDIIAEYLKENKECTFSVVQSDSRKVIDGVMEGVFDVGFVGVPCHERGIESRPVAMDEMVIIMPDIPYYREYEKKIRDLDEAELFDKETKNERYDSLSELLGSLLREPAIVREEGSGSGEMFNMMLAGCNMTVKDLNVVARVNDHEAIINMVERGVGVACISSLALWGKTGRSVISVNLPGRKSVREINMVYKTQALKKQTAGEFIKSVGIGKYRIFGQEKIIESYIEAFGLPEKFVKGRDGVPQNDMQPPSPYIISVVGAGGKSTLIEAIADEYVSRGIEVIITTTTHIREPEKMIDGKKTYFGIPVTENGVRKLKAPKPEDLKKLIAEKSCPILIEADGSKGRPCKAPADHEPVIIPETDLVIGVLSKRCVGGRITDVCHRPEVVSRLLKSGINDIICDKDLEVLFTDSNGLKKGVLQGMRYVPVLRVG